MVCKALMSTPLLSDDALRESDGATLRPVSPPADLHVSPTIEHPFYELETAPAVRTALQAVGLRARPRAGVGGSFFSASFSAAAAPSSAPKATTKDGTLESLDYSFFTSPVVLSAVGRGGAREWMWRLRALKRWGLFFTIAVLTALFATGVIFATKRLNAIKFGTVDAIIEREHAGAVWPGTAFAACGAISAAYALAAALIVVNVEPLSGGSGIPELKAYLNGVNLPRLLRFKTLAAKVVALPLALGSGLPVGYEGPMAHVGAATAAMVSQGKHWFGGFAFTLPSASFRLDASKREFVCVGAAAGVAAAFNAPAGAVVFVLEEMGALAWGGPLLWRTFISAVVAAYVIDFALSGLSGGVWGRLTAQGMFSFGLPPASESEAAWAVYEIPIFVGLGVAGGLMGAIFNALSVRLTRLRLAWLAPHRTARVVEVVLVTIVVSAVSFFAALKLGSCVEMPKDIGASGGETPARFFCPAGKFSDLASLWFVPPEEAIRLLFHLEKGSFSLIALFSFWLLYLALMCLTAGIAVPTGHFLPLMLAGCALGRLVGELGAVVAPGALASPGSYAVIGAACMLGGILHLSLSMTVILLEATGNTFFSLPLMVTLLSARFASALFGPSLYEAQVAARKWPLLEERLPKPLAFSLRACDVMSTPVLALREVERVGTLIGALRGSSHNGFPVVFGVALTAAAAAAARTAAAAAGGAAALPSYATAHRQPGTLAGYIQRRHVAVLLEARAFHKKPPREDDAPQQQQQQPPPPAAAAAAPSLPRVPSGSSLRRARGASGEGVRLRVPSVTERHVLAEALFEDGGGAHRASGGSPPLSLNSPPSGEGGGGGAASLPAPPRPRAAAAAAAAAAVHHPEFSYDNEPLVEAKAFTETYPRFPNVLALEFLPEEHGMFVDLRPYMDSTPITVHAHATLDRAYKLFTQMGLRHLIVTDDAHNAVGMVTRRDLVAERCEEVLKAVHAAEALAAAPRK